MSKRLMNRIVAGLPTVFPGIDKTGKALRLDEIDPGETRITINIKGAVEDLLRK